MNIRRTISILCCVSIIIWGIYYLSVVYEKKDSYNKYYHFFHDDYEYDVMFFGTSHVMNTIYPMQLWDECGITSYNMGDPGANIQATYEKYKLSIKYHKPKIAVFDVFFLNDEEAFTTMGTAHTALDAYPLSIEKYEAIKRLYPEDNTKVFELIFPFSVYHSRWDEVPQSEYFLGNKSINVEKGAKTLNVVAKPNESNILPPDVMIQNDPIGIYYLESIIDDCRNEGIIPILMNIPCPTNAEKQSIINTVYRLAKKKNVPFINMQIENVVDFTTDCYDADSHLNDSGARKVTSYFGQYLIDNYDLVDKRELDEYASWEEDYAIYEKYLEDNISSQNDLNSVLMLLNNRLFSADIMIGDEWESDELKDKLFDNISSHINIKSVEGSTITIRGYNAKSGEMLFEKNW